MPLAFGIRGVLYRGLVHFLPVTRNGVVGYHLTNSCPQHLFQFVLVPLPAHWRTGFQGYSFRHTIDGSRLDLWTMWLPTCPFNALCRGTGHREVLPSAVSNSGLIWVLLMMFLPLCLIFLCKLRVEMLFPVVFCSCRPFLGCFR